MANAMEGIMGLPNAPMGGQSGPSAASMVDMQALEQASAEANKDPMAFRESVLSGMEEADPQLVAEFKRALTGMQLPDDLLQALGLIVEEVMRNPANYAAVRAEMLKDDVEGLLEELLPETFDMAYFLAFDMALDQLAMNTAQAPQAFADGGLATLNPIAQAMAEMGRGGDTMLAHIRPAEARMLRARGGSGTINPYTGLPEFGFFKSITKPFRSVAKAVVKTAKKVVSTVKSVVKKVASSTIGKIALTIGATMLLGPAGLNFAGTLGLGSGALAYGVNVAAASTLVGVAGGQKFGDALKGGIVSGVMAGGMAHFAPSTLPDAYTAQAAQNAAGAAGAALPGVEDLTTKAGDLAATPGTGFTSPADVTVGTPIAEVGPGSVGVDPMTGAVTSPVPTGYNVPGMSTYELGAPGSPAFSTAPGYFPPAEQSLSTLGGGAATAPTSLTSTAPSLSLGQGMSTLESPMMGLQAPSVPTPDYLGGAQFSSQGMPMTTTPATQAGIGGLPAGNVPGAAPPGTVPAGTVPPADKSFFQKTVDFFSPSARQAAGKAGQLEAYNQTLLDTGGKLAADGSIVGGNVALATQAYKDAAPGIISTYGPLALAGVGTAAAMGAFTPPEEPSLDDLGPEFSGPSGSELLEQQPERYGVTIGETKPSYVDVGQTVYSPMGYNPQGRRNYDFRKQIAYMPGYEPLKPYYEMGYADGGIAALKRGGSPKKYPRKNGHISGPGGPKDDKIPAMLSDGEFVFTAKAVRGMGNGSRRKGAKKMYAMMKALERRTA
jgi:hypothetical protein